MPIVVAHQPPFADVGRAALYAGRGRRRERDIARQQQIDEAQRQRQFAGQQANIDRQMRWAEAYRDRDWQLADQETGLANQKDFAQFQSDLIGDRQAESFAQQQELRADEWSRQQEVADAERQKIQDEWNRRRQMVVDNPNLSDEEKQYALGLIQTRMQTALENYLSNRGPDPLVGKMGEMIRNGRLTEEEADMLLLGQMLGVRNLGEFSGVVKPKEPPKLPDLTTKDRLKFEFDLLKYLDGLRNATIDVQSGTMGETRKAPRYTDEQIAQREKEVRNLFDQLQQQGQGGSSPPPTESPPTTEPPASHPGGPALPPVQGPKKPDAIPDDIGPNADNPYYWQKLELARSADRKLEAGVNPTTEEWDALEWMKARKLKLY